MNKIKIAIKCESYRTVYFSCKTIKHEGGELEFRFNSVKEALQALKLFEDREIEAFHFNKDRYITVSSCSPVDYSLNIKAR